ncbi:MAG: TonB-dependent receptor [Pseudomonadota bacterium]
MELNIPGQPLAESLIELGRASGLRIVATGSVVGDRNAPALAGRYTPKQALDALLIGSGLMATQETDGTYVIRRDPDSAGVEDTKAVPAARTVEEILVFGVKQAIDLQDTVESAEVFTADRFDRENLFTISDALGRTPNVSTLGDDLTSINIRGINREGTNGAGQGVAINVFQDGVPLTSGSLEFGASTAWDIEQLEVLRGSQSTVQGRNSIAGAIVLQSKKPTFDWEGAARARAAEYGTLQLAAALSGPIIEDQLAFRLTVDSQETDGFIRDGLSSDTIDFRESVTVRTRFLVEPEAISDLSALFTIEYSDRNNGGASNAISERGDIDFETSDRRSFAELINFADIETWKGIADITYRFNESIVLKVLGTYEDTDLEGGNRARTANQFADVGSFDDEVTEAYSIEVRAEFDFGKLRGLAGGYYFESEGTSAASQTLVLSDTVPFPFDPVDSALTVSATSVREVENFALFTSWRFEPTDNWALDVALRYDDERFTTRRAPGTFDVFPADCTAFAPRFFFGLSGPGFAEGSCQDAAPLFIGEVEPLQSDSLSVLLPSGSLTYRITEDASIFGGYRRGYRAGGTFLAGSLSATEIFEVVTFDPEFLNTYEAGWRSQWLEKRLTLNGTLFYSEYEDQQVSFLDERDFPITDNVGETSLYGLELTGSYIFNENLNLFASLGLLETSVDEFIRAVDVPETPENEFEDFSGNELDRSPAVSANLGASYRASNGFFASASVAYQSEYFSDIFNSDDDILGNGVTERVDAAAVVNANIGFDFTDGLRITLYANNLFDEDAPESTNINARGAEEGDTSRATINYRVRQPQTFGVAVDARF